MEQQRKYLEAAERTPAQVYLLAAVGSIVLSGLLFLMGRRSLAFFVGLWPPTILATALFYKILRPSRESVTEEMRRATETMKK